MKKDTAELKSLAKHHFDLQSRVTPLWQTIAENFYPERADFTLVRNLGDELSDQLVDSYPVLVRRDLGNGIQAMLRDGDWFSVWIRHTEPDHAGIGWLQWATKRLDRLFSDRKSGFARSTKEGDHDYISFGAAVLSCQINRNRDGLAFQAHHLKDCAWWDDETGNVEGLIRKWQPTLWQLKQTFGDKIHPNHQKALKDTPFKTVPIYHFSIPSTLYGDDEIESKFAFASIYLDSENEHILEEIGVRQRQYVVPRFQTIAGSPYPYSPATVVGLADARTLQAMTFTLMEAAERYARPPIIATQQVVRSDVNLYADGITWVDKDYDERLGAALRQLPQERGGFPIGMEMRQNISEALNSAFYLNKLTLPETSHEMTAFEVNERMKQYRRENLPLFAPIIEDYNGQLCELGFSTAMDNFLLGPVDNIPQSLQGQEVSFRFVSPLSKSEEEEQMQRFQEMSQMLATAAQFDQNAIMNVNFDTALRDAVMARGTPATWLNDPEQVAQGRQLAMAQQAMMAAQEAQANQPPEAVA